MGEWDGYNKNSEVEFTQLLTKTGVMSENSYSSTFNVSGFI